MSSRNLCVSIERVEIDVRENAVVGVPAADLRFFVAERKFGALSAAALDNKDRVNAGRKNRSCRYLGFILRTILLDYRRDADGCY